jgi:transposase
LDIMSYREAARRLGVGRMTISDLVRKLGIKPVRHPSNGAAKGLTSKDFRKISASVGQRKVAQPA